MIIALDYAKVDGDAPPDVARARGSMPLHSGVAIAYIRGEWEYRGKAYTDDTLMRDAPAWRAGGAKVGAYLFLDYEGDPEAAADALAAVYKRLPGDMPVALDLEMDVPPPNTTAAQRVAIAEKALARLQQHYGTHGVIIYSSLEQWQDHFGDLPSDALGKVPLWIKTPYPWKPHNPPHLESTGPVGQLPRPWRATGSPGAWMQQFQGDCIGWPGFTSTVDVSQFLVYRPGQHDSRDPWVAELIGCALVDLPVAFPAWQKARGLVADSVAGPASFCMWMQDAPVG